MSKAAGRASVLKALAEHVRTNEAALVFLQNSDDATYVAKTLNAAGCATRSLNGGSERRLLGRRTDSGQDAGDIVLLAGSGSASDLKLGIVVGASRDKLQLIQRVGQVVRKTGNDKGARLVTVQIEGIDSASDSGALDVVESHAASTRRFTVAELVSLHDFLVGDEESDEPEGDAAE